ncbi:MAG: preprotein translocase subunit YajC [Oscillospiraceae bacterium]|nr:preprotein translocase subunit YajC [Oscillospiraceae bacterium]
MNFTPVMLAEAAASGGSTTSAMLSMLITFVPLFAVFYFLIVRPQKKREKEEKEMRESISIGDEIITIGGIIGLVVRQTDDTLVIETGGDRSKLRIQKSAVKENVTARERMQAAAV